MKGRGRAKSRTTSKRALPTLREAKPFKGKLRGLPAAHALKALGVQGLDEAESRDSPSLVPLAWIGGILVLGVGGYFVWKKYKTAGPAPVASFSEVAAADKQPEGQPA